jgi:hypothetical protein
MIRIAAIVALLCSSISGSAATLAESARLAGCTDEPVAISSGLYKCTTEKGADVFFNTQSPGGVEGSGASKRTTAYGIGNALATVKIGMTRAEVERIGQVGDRCTDWPRQRPPRCGPLHYYSDRRTVETALGKTAIHYYGRDQIVYRDGVVVEIVR